jgi:hypothetical protein
MVPWRRFYGFAGDHSKASVAYFSFRRPRASGQIAAKALTGVKVLPFASGISSRILLPLVAWEGDGHPVR